MAKAGDPDAMARVKEVIRPIGLDTEPTTMDRRQATINSRPYIGRQNDAEFSKGAATKTRAEMTPFERKQAKLKSRQATMANGGMATSVSPEDATRARAQAPAVAKAMQPTTTTSIDPPVAPANTTAAGTAGENGGALPQDSNKELFERMVANQEQTNSLLRRGNKTTADLKDNF